MLINVGLPLQGNRIELKYLTEWGQSGGCRLQVPMLLGREEVVLVKQTWRLVKCIRHREHS